VWSDDNDNVYLDPHTNFNLTSTGEYLSMSDTLGNVFQTTTVPAQNIDEAWGRCYDSTGEFNINSNPTPRNINECVVLVDDMNNDTFSVFPIPALNSITILSNQEIGRIEIFDFTGKRVLTEQTFGSRCEISIDSFQSGIYALRRNGGKIILIEKL
jgi:hypothetical protein